MQEISHSGATVVRYRAMILAAVMVALVALSFHGALDDFAHEQVADTTTQSIGIYATARLINAGVSALQTSELKVPFLASIRVGELLDPVNDVIERLSSIMVWAIGSLFLQRIVLEIASSPVFKWSFLAFGLAAISALLLFEWKRSRNVFLRMIGISETTLNRCRNLMIRVFVIAVMFRFIVPVFIALSFLLSQMILESEIDKNSETLSSLGAEVQTDTVDDRPLGDQKSQKEAELEGLEGALDSLERESEILDEDLVFAKTRREEIGHQIDQVRRQIEEEGEILECIDRRIAGERCESFLERFMQFQTDSVDDRSLADQKSQKEDELEGLDGALDSLRQKLGTESLLERFTQFQTDSVDDRPLPDQKIQKEAKLEGLGEALDLLKRGFDTLDKELISTKARREEIGHKMDQIRRQIEEESEILECIDRRLAGERCESFLERLSSAGKAEYARIARIVDMAGDMTTNIIKLLAAVVIKNIVIPLVFLVLAVKCSLPMIKYSMWLVQDTRREVGALRNMSERTDQEG